MPVAIESTQANNDGQFLSGLVNSATGGISGLVSAGVGALTNAIFNTKDNADARQLNQQGALDAQQLSYQEQAMDYQQQNQLKTWQETNAPAQVQQYELAGLNPALMYGGGGGGGATIGGGIPSEQGASAPDAVAQQQQDMQKTQMIEQMKVMDSQAALNNAQAAKIAGADTENTKTDTALKETTTTGTQLKNQFQEIQNNIAKATTTEQINQVFADVQKTWEQTNNLIAQNRTANVDASVKEATKQQAIQQFNANLTQTLTDIIQKQANTKLTEEQTKAVINSVKNNDASELMKLGIHSATDILKIAALFL